MKLFKAGQTVRPKAKLLPIDSGNSEIAGQYRITDGIDLLVNTVTAPHNGEQMLSFLGIRGSYVSSFFELVDRN